MNHKILMVNMQPTLFDKKFYSSLEFDRFSSVPLHLQLSEKLINRIRQCKPEVGARLLSERKLASLLNLDRSTIHRAYMELYNSNLVVEKEKRRGLFVSVDCNEKLKIPFPCIGVILPTTFSEFVDSKVEYRLNYMKGVIDCAAKLDLSVIMINLPEINQTDFYIKEWKKHVIDRLSGIIHLGHRSVNNLPDDPVLNMILEDKNIPQIFISGYSQFSHIGSLCCDFTPGALACAEFFIEQGHKKIAIVTNASQDYSNYFFQYESLRRPAIVRKTLASCNIEVPQKWMLYNCSSLEHTRQQLNSIFKSREKPSAFFCANEVCANFIVKVLLEKGIKVPEDISVSGVDGINNDDNVIDFSSIRIPFYSLGYSALSTLYDYIDKGINDENRLILQPTSFIIKSSVGKNSK